MFEFEKGILLVEPDYRILWNHFVKELKIRIQRLGRGKRDELLKSRKTLEEWIKDQVMEMFEVVLKSNRVKSAMIYLRGEWYYVPDSEEFYNLSYSVGSVSSAVAELERELRGSVKSSGGLR